MLTDRRRAQRSPPRRAGGPQSRRRCSDRLQADIHADRPAPGEPLPGAVDERLLLAEDDDSVRIHACHGRARQVEVLREAILHRLADDPTLEPRDIIVMCPDIETFAPLIQATFGASADVGDIDLRVRLADRSLRQVNPLLSVVARLLELAHARLTASEVLDFADTEPVRRRFRLDDDDLAQIQSWVAGRGHPLGPRRSPPPRLQTRRCSTPAPGRRACVGCCSALPSAKPTDAGSGRRCRSTRSTAAGSNWLDASPS